MADVALCYCGNAASCGSADAGGRDFGLASRESKIFPDLGKILKLACQAVTSRRSPVGRRRKPRSAVHTSELASILEIIQLLACHEQDANGSDPALRRTHCVRLLRTPFDATLSTFASRRMVEAGGIELIRRIGQFPTHSGRSGLN